MTSPASSSIAGDLIALAAILTGTAIVAAAFWRVGRKSPDWIMTVLDDDLTPDEIERITRTLDLKGRLEIRRAHKDDDADRR